MKLLFNISKEQFDTIVKEFTALKANDYYERPIGIKRLPAPAGGFDSTVEKFTVTPCYGDALALYCGYTVNEAGACYTTSGGNSWGVVEGEDGQHFSFYHGRRSRVRYMPHFAALCDLNAAPVEYVSSGPSDMRWYDSESSYVIRQGAEKSAQYLASRGGWPVHGEAGENQLDIAVYFERQLGAGEFETMVHRATLQGQDPEVFLLRTLRNKKVKPEMFDPKQQVAWDLLEVDVKERILKYA